MPKKSSRATRSSPRPTRSSPRSQKRAAPAAKKRARATQSAATAPSPRATHAVLKFTPADAIARADNAIALVHRAGIRTRIERRLPAGTIERLAHDTATLREKRESGTVALASQLGATGDSHDASENAIAWLASVRRSARSSTASPSVLRRLGVGIEVHASDPTRLGAVVRTAAEALDVPAIRNAVGRLPEDAVAGHALATALGAARTEAQGSRTARKDTTRARNESQRALEADLFAVSIAGTDEFWHPAERTLHDEFVALVELPAAHTKSKATPAPAAATAAH